VIKDKKTAEMGAGSNYVTSDDLELSDTRTV